MVTVVTGEISHQEGLREALELVRESRDVKNGLLRIVSKEVSGKLGIFCSRYITGAQIASTGETGAEAVKKLLAVRQGMFAYVEAEVEQDSGLKQSLGLDINLLLEWTPDGSDEVSTLDKAVDSIPKGGNDSLFLVNEVEDLLESNAAITSPKDTAAAEAVELLKNTFAGGGSRDNGKGLEDTDDNIEAPRLDEDQEQPKQPEKKEDEEANAAEKKEEEETVGSNGKLDHAESVSSEDSPHAADLDALLSGSETETVGLDDLLSEVLGEIAADKAASEQISAESSSKPSEDLLANLEAELKANDEPVVEDIRDESPVEAKLDEVHAKTDQVEARTDESEATAEIVTDSVDEVETKVDAPAAEAEAEEEEEEEEAETEKEEVPIAEQDKPEDKEAEDQESPDEPSWDATVPEEKAEAAEAKSGETFDANPDSSVAEDAAPVMLDWGDAVAESVEPAEVPTIKKGGGFLSKLTNLAPGHGKGDKGKDSKKDEDKKLPAVPVAPIVPDHLDEAQAEKVFSDLERSIMRSSLPAEIRPYSSKDLDSIPTPNKTGGFDPDALDSIPTPATGLSGDYGLGKKNSAAESKAGIEARDFFQSESQKMTAVDPKQFLSQTGTFKKLSAAEMRAGREPSTAAMIAAGTVVFMLGACILFFGIQLVTTNPIKQHMHLGSALLDSGKADLAIKEFSDVLAIEPKNKEAFLKRASAYMEKSDFDRAIEDYTTVLTMPLERWNVAALLGRGTAHFRSHLYGDAVEDLTDVIKADNPKDIHNRMIEPHKLRAEAYIHEEEYDSALKDLDKILIITRDKSLMYETYCSKASVYAKKGDHKKAAGEYGRALSMDPRSEAAYLGRAGEYLEMGAFSAAIADCDSLLKIMPSLGRAYYIRGLGHQRLNELRPAVQDFDRAINLNGSIVDAYIQRGKIHMNLNDYKSALSDFDDSLKLKPDDAAVKKLRDIAYHKQPRAIVIGLPGDVYATPTASEPKTNNPTELVSIGYKMLRTNPAGAVPALTKAVRLSSNDPAARRYLGLAYLYAGQPSAAATQFATLTNMEGSTIKDRIYLGSALLSAGQIEQAITTYETTVSDYDNQEARLGLARAYASAGFYEKCKMICREGISKARSHAEMAAFERMAANPAAAVNSHQAPPAMPNSGRPSIPALPGMPGAPSHPTGGEMGRDGD